MSDDVRQCQRQVTQIKSIIWTHTKHFYWIKNNIPVSHLRQVMLGIKVIKTRPGQCKFKRRIVSTCATQTKKRRPFHDELVLNDFPDDMQFRILSFLSAVDLAQCAPVSKSFRVIAYDDTLWRPLLTSYGICDWKDELSLCELIAPTTALYHLPTYSLSVRILLLF